MTQCSAVNVYNKQGELALQMRAADDDRYPGRWDFAAGGHIEEGETPEQGAVRELREEIGIESPLEYVMLMHHPGGSDAQDEPDDLAIYRTIHEGPFVLDPKEVSEVRFFSIERIKEMATKEPQTLHPELTYFLTHHADKL